MSKRGERRRKAPHGQGGVHERKDGRFEVYLEGRRTTLGKHQKAEAYRLLNRWRHERDEGTLLSAEAEKITVGEYLDGWLETVEGTVARQSYHSYEGKIKLHLKPTLGAKRLKDLTAADLQRLYSQKLKEGLSPRTVGYIHTTISKALNQAEAWDLVKKNVARHARPPKKAHSERKVLTTDEVRTFLEVAREDRFYALYVVALTTGLRRGELLALKWTDLDLQRKTLRVQRSLDTHYAPAQENAPKRAASRRSVRLLPEAIAALEDHRRRQLHERLRAGPRWQGGAHDYIFPTIKGTPMNGDNLVARSLRPLLAKASLPPITFHELRHTFATMLVSQGEHPRVIQAMMGHGSIASTMNTYSHILEGMDEEAIRRLRRYLFGEER